MAHFQLSLFGKTSWEHFHQMTGWILEPCCNPSQPPRFQCLLLDDGQMPEWCEGERLTSLGGSWMPNIGEGPDYNSEEGASSSWRILEDSVPPKYFITTAVCSKILRLAQRAGCPPPREIEYLLLKQGGSYPSSTPFKTDVCVAMPKRATMWDLSAALENQLTLFPRS